MTTDQVKTGALLVGFGGPRSLDEVEPMLTAVARASGTVLPPAALAGAKRKYAAIGGASPLTPIMGEVGRALKAHFAAAGVSINHIELGMLFTPPSVEDAFTALQEKGCTQVIYLSMTPFTSHAAYGGPLQLSHAVAAGRGMEVLAAPTFGSLDAYLQGMEAHIKTAGLDLGTADANIDTPRTHLIFAAHSLSLDDESEDPVRYDEELRRAAALITEKLSLSAYSLAYTSQGARGGRWLTPTMQDAIDAACFARATGVLVCPLGFATDHMEVLYDLDITARALTEQQGLDYKRADTLATRKRVSPYLTDALTQATLAAIEAGAQQ